MRKQVGMLFEGKLTLTDGFHKGLSRCVQFGYPGGFARNRFVRLVASGDNR